MKLYYLILSIGCMMMAVSCEKAYTPANITPGSSGSGGSSTNNGLLVKNVSIDNTDTTVYTYQYNTSKQLIGIGEAVNQPGASAMLVYKFIRDNSGKVVRVVYGTPVTTTSSVLKDSILANVHYPAGAGNFDYKLASYSVGGVSIADSTCYTYLNGKIAMQSNYLSSAGKVYDQKYKAEYTYDPSGNISTLKISNYRAGTVYETLTISFQYDTKNAAIQAGNEGIFFNIGEMMSKNNVVKSIAVDNNGTTNDTSTSDVVYQYNTANFPISAVATDNPGGTTSRATYFYQ